MNSFIYKSSATKPFNDKALRALTTRSAAKNRVSGITGYLWYLDGTFIQYIEGSENALNHLKASIESDSRHNILVSSFNSELDRRLFPYWTMKRLSENEAYKMQFEYLVSRNLDRLKFAEDKELVDKLMWRQLFTLSQQQYKLQY